MDASFRLLAEWSSQSPEEMARVNHVIAHFRDRETEYETGELVLPSWASMGNVAAQYSPDDADPFAAPADDQ